MRRAARSPRLLDSSILVSRLNHHLDPDRHSDRRGQRLPQGRQEAGGDAVARDGVRSADEQGCSIPSDQPGRPQPGLEIGPADVAPSRQLGQGRRPDLPVGEPDLLDGEERR